MRSALGFLTVVGGAAPPDRRAPAWFGPVGAALGLAVGGAWWVAGELWPALVAALLAVAVDAALTGMLHFDGLADSADGLLPPLDRRRRLEVMAAPDIGAFGVMVVTLVVLARVAALAAVAPDPLLVACHTPERRAAPPRGSAPGPPRRPWPRWRWVAPWWSRRSMADGDRVCSWRHAAWPGSARW
jgi:adenosylcobinamide-GDP ribazoletransferase